MVNGVGKCGRGKRCREEKALCREPKFRRRNGFLLDDTAEVLHRKFSPSYIEQRSYDGPHHVTEEAVGSDGKYLSFAFGFPAGECHSAIIGFNIGMQFAKTGEIGISVELFGRRIHFVKVEISPITAGEGFDNGDL